MNDDYDNHVALAVRLAAAEASISRLTELVMLQTGILEALVEDLDDLQGMQNRKLQGLHRGDTC